MEISVALVVCHAKEAAPPACMLLGSTEIEAVGAGGGGGGGGGAGAAFFLQPPSITIAPNAKTIVHISSAVSESWEETRHP
jgi:hypothetical protein